jgi:hypothetical protein
MVQPAESPSKLASPFRPFDLDNEAAYRAWRARKLESRPARADELIVEVRDPRRLSAAEQQAILARCRAANMAVYASNGADAEDKAIPAALARQFGLQHIDHNWLADGDAITPLTVHARGARPDYIPYTNRPIKWHTDGYYNPPQQQVRGLLLHCVRPAAHGGQNALLDHELAYIWLRDLDPDYVRALMQPDVMTIPARLEQGRVVRPEQAGPVFSVNPADGALHMRYTARARNVRWKDEAVVTEARRRLEQWLNGTSSYVYRLRLESGMGLLCNNVLHDRAGFEDAEDAPRLLYRARFYDRMRGTDFRHLEAG